MTEEKKKRGREYGGESRAAALSASRRSAIARKAAQERWTGVGRILAKYDDEIAALSKARRLDRGEAIDTLLTFGIAAVRKRGWTRAVRELRRRWEIPT